MSQLNELLVSALRHLEKEVQHDHQSASPRPKSREGKKTIVGHFAPEIAWQLRKLALDQNTTVQKLLEESMGDLFEKYHLPRL